MVKLPPEGTLLNILAVSICMVYGLRFLFLAWRSRRSADWILRHRDRPLSEDGFPDKIVLCCPLYAESRWIPSLLNQLSALEYDPNRLRVVFITNRSDDTGTAQLLASELSENPLPYHTDSLVVAGSNKAESMNAALRTLASKYPDWFDERTYVGVFDVDTEIQSRMLQYVGRDEDRPAAYTGTSIYGLNLVGEGAPRSRLLRAFAVMQTQWALGFEFSRVIGDFESGRHKLQYIVGHGSFYRWDILDAYRFPTEADDIPLGYLLTAKCHRIKPLPSVEFIGGTVNVRALLAQIGRWFRANYLMFRFRNYVDDLPTWVYLNLLYETFVNPVAWILGPVLLLASLFYLGVTAPLLALAVLLWIVLTAQISGLMTYRSMVRLKPATESVIESPTWATPFLVYSVLKSAGAWHRAAVVVLSALTRSPGKTRSTPKADEEND